MGDVVNLNQFRKQRARASAERQAAENRTRHGRSKLERQLAKTERTREQQELEGKRLPPAPPEKQQDD